MQQSNSTQNSNPIEFIQKDSNVKKKFTGNQKRRPHSGTKPSASPVTGIPKPLYPSTQTSVLKNDLICGSNYFDTSVSSLQPVSVRPDYCADMSGYADLVESSYNAIRSKNTKLSTTLPYCLYAYYCFSLCWLRLLTITYMNRTSTAYRVEEMIHKFRVQAKYVLPEALVHWLNGIGDTKDLNGDYFRMCLFDLPTAVPFDNNLRGTFGRANMGTFPSYASLASPYVYTKFIQLSLQPNVAENVGNWVLGPAVHPLDNDPQLRSYICTPNLLGYSQLKPLNRRAMDMLGDYGFTQTQIPRDASNFLNISFDVITSVSQIMSDLKNVSLSTIDSQLMDSSGSTAVLPYITVSEDCDPWQRTATNQTVRLDSRYQLDPELASIAFCQAYRVQRTMSYNGLRSNCSPFQHVEMNVRDPNARTIIDFPNPLDLNRPFNAGDGALRLNPRYFRGASAERDRHLAAIMDRFNTKLSSI